MTYRTRRFLIVLLAAVMLALASIACDDPLAQSMAGSDPGYAAPRNYAGNYECAVGYRKSAALDTGKPWCFVR